MAISNKLSGLPTTAPPPSLWPRLLPRLIDKLSSSPSSELSIIQSTLYIISQTKLRPNLASTIPRSALYSTIPLDALLKLTNSSPNSKISITLLIDLAIAYPSHPSSINKIYGWAFLNDPRLIDDFRLDIIPSLLSKLRNDNSNSEVNSIAIATRVLLSIIRGHEEVLALALEDSEAILKTLAIAYSSPCLNLNQYEYDNGDSSSMSMSIIKVKENIIMICKELLNKVGVGASSEAMLRFMGDQSSSPSSTNTNGELFIHQSLRDDWEQLFGGHENEAPGLSEEKKITLGVIRDQEAQNDLRVQSLLQLFPTLSPHLLLQALSHPQYQQSTSRATPSEQAAPLLETILSGGQDLPLELEELRDAIKALGEGQATAAVPQEDVRDGQPEQKQKQKSERRNIWADEELDISRLKMKEDDSALPTLSSAIPTHLRESIMRLVETQAEEDLAREQALKAAYPMPNEPDPPRHRRDYDLDPGYSDVEGDVDADEDERVPGRIKVGGGDEEDPDDSLSEEDGVKINREAGQSRDMIRLNLLRETYTFNPAVFERDGVTRRSAARKILREQTGWDDGQIEGWRIMLERDPHKDAILAEHQMRSNTNNHNRNQNQNSRTRGGGGEDSSASASGSGTDNPRRGGSGGGRGRGRGGGHSDTAGTSGGGGGGGRGRGGGRGGSKSSRGHQNAARTRGHDRKMGKMGAL